MMIPSFSTLTTVFAQAAPGGSAPGGLFGNPLVFMILMMVIMYFILIRPQRNRQKEQDKMQKAISAGDEIVTIGGAHGTIVTVKEKTVVVRVAEGKVEFDRSAIARRTSKSDAAISSEGAK